MEDYKCWTTSNRSAIENPPKQGKKWFISLPHTPTHLLTTFMIISPLKKKMRIIADSLEDSIYGTHEKCFIATMQDKVLPAKMLKCLLVLFLKSQKQSYSWQRIKRRSKIWLNHCTGPAGPRLLIVSTMSRDDLFSFFSSQVPTTSITTPVHDADFVSKQFYLKTLVSNASNISEVKRRKAVGEWVEERWERLRGWQSECPQIQ